ncbi:hypothetical protein ABZ477_11325 [Microbacterium sp. NPDC019599]|uniref:hypothetical protein n=1 Tax=Microbacterium sp. NPDC019599 TaxID=3154690 RepID=UPI0033EA1285
MTEGTKITSYAVTIGDNGADLTLEGDPDSNLMHGTRIARIEYAPGAEPKAIINRGGFLSIDRPLELLAPTLALLQSGLPVVIDEAGALSASGTVGGAGDGSTEDEPDPETPDPA